MSNSDEVQEERIFTKDDDLPEEDEDRMILLGSRGRLLNAPRVRKTNNSISEDLSKMTEVPIEVRDKADMIFRLMGSPNHRHGKRLKLMFFCIYCAYRDLNIDTEPVLLGMSMGIAKKDITTSVTKFLSKRGDYVPSNRHFRPTNCMSSYCKVLSLNTEQLTSITKISEEVLAGDPSLLQYNPQKVAASIMSYFISIEGLDGVIKDDEIKEKLKIKDVKAFYNQVSKAHDIFRYGGTS